MRFRAISGHSDLDHAVIFIMECSGCGKNLREFHDEIDRHKLKYCPSCGKKLNWRCRLISNDKVVDILNKAIQAEGEEK